MTADDVTPPDEEFTDLLAACDEALAVGGLPRIPADAAPPVELRPRLERGLACLFRLQGLRPSRGSELSVADVPVTRSNLNTEANPTAFQQLGRFEILHELGRGGFGVVYLAYDPQLNREVALKVPHPDALIAPDLRQRFQNEARLAAALDHPNVVRVYEAGEIGSVCYTVTAYCPGGTLAHWLKRRTEPVPFAAAARMLQTLAEAVQYAHGRGVLHRDLKPANILLQNKKSVVGWAATACPLANLSPMVADFGLAKLLDGGAGSTRTGAVLGTPSYMAPEQADGRRRPAGPAADVYSLGAILYEVLTGRPPFEGDSAVDTLQQVRFDEPVPPRRLRPKCPRDLETICLKCLQKDPKKRYPSAQALANDLRCFAAGEPIRARPVGTLERALRWCRRNPRVAALLALLVLTFAGGFAGVAWQKDRAQTLADDNARLAIVKGQALELAKRDRDAAVRDRELADARFRIARDAVDRLTQFGEEMANRPGMDATRRGAMERALSFYLDLLKEKSDDVALWMDAARAWSRVGVLRHALGQSTEAAAAFDSCAALLDRLRKDFPDRPEYVAERSACHRLRGVVHRASGQQGSARVEFEKSVALCDELLRARPSDTAYQGSLTASLVKLADVQGYVGKRDDAEATYQRALKVEREVLAIKHDDVAVRESLGDTLAGLAALRRQPARLKESAEFYEQSLDVRRKLADDFPAMPWHKFNLSQSLMPVGGMTLYGDPPARAKCYKEALGLLEQLVAGYPDAPDYRSSLANVAVRLSDDVMPPRGGKGEAAPFLRIALGQYEKLAADFPKKPDYHASVVATRFLLAKALGAGANPREAVTLYRQAIADKPDLEGPYVYLSMLLSNSDDPTVRDPVEALRVAEKAVALPRPTVVAWFALGIARYRNDNLAGAVEAIERGRDRMPGAGDSETFFLAMALHRLGDRTKAKTYFDRAARVQERMPDHAELRRWRAEAEAVLAKP